MLWLARSAADSAGGFGGHILFGIQQQCLGMQIQPRLQGASPKGCLVLPGLGRDPGSLPMHVLLCTEHREREQGSPASAKHLLCWRPDACS